jgi:long-chain fatty acid transport protein
MTTYRRTSISLFILCTCFISATAAAGGFATARFGGEHGHPATDHPTALYFNPAGLALGTGTRMYLEGLFAYRSASYDRPAGAVDNVLEDGTTGSGTPDSAINANAGRAELGNLLASPFFGIVSDLGIENLGVGAGVYVPFGGSATWDQNLSYVGDEQYPGAVDGVQRWWNIEGTQKSLYGTVAAAYRIPGANLSIGAGANLVRTEVETVRARTALGTDDLMAGTDTIIEGRSYLEVSGNTMSVSGGLAWQPVEVLTIGASYQSQPGFGEHSLEGVLINKFGTTPETENEVVLRQSLPDVFRLGFRWLAAPRVELRASGDYTRWSAYDNQCLLDARDPDAKCAFMADGSVDTAAGGAGIVLNIPRNYRDTYGVRAGGSYWTRPNLELFGGAAYDSNAVPDETIDAALMDMDKLIGTLGLRYGFMREALTLSAAFTQVVYLDRTVDPRDRDADGNPIAMSSPSRNPDGAGTYKQAVSLLTIGLQYAF